MSKTPAWKIQTEEFWDRLADSGQDNNFWRRMNDFIREQKIRPDQIINVEYTLPPGLAKVRIYYIEEIEEAKK